ncbi:MAG: hypothetical protein LBS42_05495 [Tannerella sp.]|nr:hypothetical protein [Tannerella sp.]
MTEIECVHNIEARLSGKRATSFFMQISKSQKSKAKHNYTVYGMVLCIEFKVQKFKDSRVFGRKCPCANEQVYAARSIKIGAFLPPTGKNQHKKDKKTT